MELNCHFVHSRSMGYGRFGSSIVEALTALGVDVYDDMPMPDEARRAHEHNVGARRKLCRVTLWMSVPTHARGWWSNQYPVCYTMWESSGLPESFRETLHQFAQIVVPSRQNQELFSRYHPNVAFVPLGIDPTWWHPLLRPPLGSRFTFLIAGAGPRKGTDLAYKAFRAAFSTWPKDGPIPYLVMKNPRSEPFYGERIEIIGGKISAQAEVDLYASAHCYVGPSRGEGFGLQPLQAMAQGCPTILTAAHGHDAFAHLGLPLSTTMAKSAYFIYGDAGEWWEPSLDELVDHMRWVYANYDEAVAMARTSAEVIAAEFTWRRAGERLIDVIGMDRLTTPLADPGEWFTPERKRYLVITNRDWACDIAGTAYQFRQGERYHELADVKRILYEANILDPACLDPDDDTGLTESQLAEMKDYSASRSFCRACGQRLGSGEQRADVIERELANGLYAGSDQLHPPAPTGPEPR
jgi:Glycosyltransferase